LRAIATFGDFPSSPHHQVKILAAPFRLAAYRHLRCFHQQETHHRTALFGNVPSRRRCPLESGACSRNSPQIIQITRGIVGGEKLVLVVTVIAADVQVVKSADSQFL
jgi:hypothetical protein